MLISALALPAQQAPSAAQSLTAQKQGALKISTLEGEGAKNNTRARTAVAPVVEVKDADDKPVAGAEVVFQLPPVGPSGAFNGWLKSQTVRTNEKGVATVTGYTPNSEQGRFNIKVTAASGAQTGSAVIAQSNVDGPTAGGKKSGGWWKVALIAGGAAVAIGVGVAAGGDDAAATAAKVPVTITSGGVTVGSPR
ncbi:MAG: hypothetical protein JJE04_23205 [Acidobacteriia bacterium]|nr:hypothetical protein [Terriglobia bacterium]